MARIPQNNWRQSNRSDIYGDIVESFNLNPNENVGRVRTLRSKLIKSGDGALDNFGRVAAIVYYNASIRVFAGTQGGDNLWNGGNSPFDSLTVDNSATSVDITDGDAVVFNNELYTTEDDSINKWNLTTETVVSNGGLTSNTNHLLCVFSPDGNGDRLYVTEDDDKIWSVSQADALATSSSYTLDLSVEPDYQLTVLMASENRIWGAVSTAGNNVGAGRSFVFEWDGVTANSISSKYYIDSPRIMAGVIKDQIPYILDGRGRLMVFNGTGFIEVDRFPMTGIDTFISSPTNMSVNAVHPRGMVVDNDEILICATNLLEGSSGATTRFADFPAGVWAWNERNGLYHKIAPSYQAVGDTGTTNLTDYGQYRAAYGGPINVFDVVSPTSSDGGRVMFGMSYFTDADDNLSSDLSYGIFTDDTADDTQKAGILVTPKIPSSQFRDIWQKIYASISDLSTTGDKVEIKYRTKNETPTIATARWDSTSAFFTDTDLSAYEEGDEVFIIQGIGAGKCVHIKDINSDAGTRIILDDTITGATGTFKVKLEKWKKVGSVEDVFKEGFNIGEEDHWVQIKLYMQWTGENELYNLLITNSSSIT